MCAVPLRTSLRAAWGDGLRRDVRLVNEMYHIAVEADDDDDDEIVSHTPLSLVPAKLCCWLSVHQSDPIETVVAVGSRRRDLLMCATSTTSG